VAWQWLKPSLGVIASDPKDRAAIWPSKPPPAANRGIDDRLAGKIII